MAEPVRLVIWDLDDTFWSGTLTEGGARIIPEHVELVKELSLRGIINSVCSKNDFDKVRAELEAAGVWDYFVFPQIDWVAKGAMVRRIVEWSQLRPETILFIDDNPINLNEVHHSNPSVQIASPELIPHILNDPLFKGKNDTDLTRLKQYKILETKELDRSKCEDKNHEFLAQSGIRISFHHDVLNEFDRIYELVNRTNQLNFTKKRWAEDKTQARAALEKDLDANPTAYVAYVKAADKYGDYGIIGFYTTKIGPKGRYAEQFTFSCRTLNMGIEQFVYRKINSPHLEIVGEVVSEPRTDEKIDWITICEDASQSRDEDTSTRKLRICVRGACELDQAVHYLGHRHNIVREFNFGYRGWAAPLPAAQLFTLWSSIDKPRNAEINTRLSAFHKSCLDNDLRMGRADAYVFSFPMEAQWSYYAFKTTGLEVPLRLSGREIKNFGDLTKLSYEELRVSTSVEVSAADWEWFCANFEYVGKFTAERFVRNLRDLRPYIANKQSLFLLLNTKHGHRGPLHEFNAQVNEIVRAEVADLQTHFVDLDDLIVSPAEVLDAQHFRRSVYPRIANAISQFLEQVSREPVVA